MTPKGSFTNNDHTWPNCRTVWNRPCSFGRSNRSKAYQSPAVGRKEKNQPRVGHPSLGGCSCPFLKNATRNTKSTSIVGTDSTIDVGNSGLLQFQSKRKGTNTNLGKGTARTVHQPNPSLPTRKRGPSTSNIILHGSGRSRDTHPYLPIGLGLQRAHR
ncbi:unnamed protein product [Prunus armeniaca]